MADAPSGFYGPCFTCKRRVELSTGAIAYAGARLRDEILAATPKEVWDAYLADGYTLIEAANEELSYAEPF